ncbi:MAG: ATP-binding cassette domain-containing protein [Paracraurococcus sp.]
MTATLALPRIGRPAAPRPGELAAAAVLCLVLSVAVQGTLLVAPLLTMHVFDGVIASRNLDTLTALSLGGTVALVLGGLLRVLRAALLAGIAEQLGRRLQLRAVVASVRVALDGDRARPALALQDVSELRRLLGGSLPADLLDLLSMPVALGFLWVLHPAFFAVALAVLAVKTVLAIAADRATRVMVRDATAAAARSAAGLTAALRHADTVRGLGLMPAVLRRWAPDWVGALEQQDAAQRRAKAMQALLQLATFAQQVGIVAIGAWLTVRQECSPGAMMAATIMVGFATSPLVALVAQWRDWSFGLLAIRRLRALAADGAPPAPLPPVPDAAPGLVLDGVTVRPPGGTRVLVRDLTLRLAPGEAWALLGPNGIGKTSLLRAVLGLAAPAAGRVLLDGQDMLAADRAALGRRVGYLGQEAQLLDGTVMENIGRFGEADAAGVVAAARQAGAHAHIGRLQRGYDTPAGSVAGLSGGQQRLIGLARALHGTPRLVVLDEPEAGLDAASRASLRDAVRQACAQGAVVLLVTHQHADWAEVLDGTLRLGPDGTWSVARERPAA